MPEIDKVQFDFLSFCFDIFNPKIFPSYFYHYTSPEGFCSIIESHQLWFTRFDCLNDETEREYIYEVFSSICEKLKLSGKINLEFYNEIVELRNDDMVMIGHSDDEIRYETADCDFYICCFSKARDSLPMWNYYCKNSENDGFNIEFSSRIFDSRLRRKRNCHLNMVEVIYDGEKQSQITEEAILRLYELWNKYRDIQEVKQCLKYFLQVYEFVFKNQTFQYEEEIRLILSVSKKGNPYFPVQYRSAYGKNVPYISLEFDRSVAVGATLGPRMKKRTTVTEIFDFAYKNGYHIIDIQSSRIPLRTNI